MSTCSATPDTAEQYVSGGLSEPERAAFEDHFFDCDTCLATVQALQSARSALAVSAAVVEASPRTPSSRRPYAWLALAAVLVLSVVVARLPRPVEPESPSTIPPATPAGPTITPPSPAVPPAAAAASDVNERLAAMAAVTPPPYVSLTTRSTEDADARAFEDAMAHYSAGRYADAARALAAISGRSPQATHVHFFLGVSRLMAGDDAGARQALSRTVRANQAPYSDEAHFYLAKAAIRGRDLESARAALRAAVEHGAGPKGEAARLLDEIGALRR